ncbi:SRPBCC family protein [Streptomyces vilmorinianum]|uniref:SRPBCC family protein n=1 Tax=Streptomyces vilmorinianum TaxID=3051092 RepID=UPI0010FB04FE|nr:SRPBCC family protein [Streptomyces vilmorinianum]
MTLDETAQRVIPLPPARVAAYAMDWRHDAEWTQGIREAALTREAESGGFGVGAEVTRTAHFLGRRIDYVLRVAAYDPPELLDMISVAGPMPMHVTYTFTPHPRGTLARIRVYLQLHRVRSRIPQGQELRTCDAGPGWSQPDWC